MARSLLTVLTIGGLGLAVGATIQAAVVLDTHNIGSVASWDVLDDPSNVTLTYSYAGPKAILKQLVIPAPLTFSAGARGYAKEASILATTSGGFSLDLQRSSKTGYSGTYTDYNTKTTTLTTPIAIVHGQQFSFQFYEQYDDSNNQVDQTWGSLKIQFVGDVFAPPTSKTVSIGSSSIDMMVGQQVIWYKVDIATNGLYAFDTDGTFITTVNGRPNDTMLAIYDTDGVLLESNHDAGVGLYTSKIQRLLNAGTYYLAAGGTNITFANDFIASSASIQTGSLHLNASLVPEPASVSLMLAGACLLGSRMRR